MRRYLVVLLACCAVLCGTMTAAGAASATSKPKITLKVSQATVVLGGSVMLSGKVKGASAGIKVQIQAKRVKKWKTLATVRTKKKGKFTYEVQPKLGKTSYRARRPKTEETKAAHSKRVSTNANPPEVPVIPPVDPVDPPIDPVDPPADPQPYSFALIGDMPYGTSEMAVLSNRIDQLNAASDLTFVAHLGDITGGGTTENCSDSYNATIKSEFDRSIHPFVYTPGDNEWADCSDAGIGAANPLSRLVAVRTTFFPTPGTTLGTNPMQVDSQSATGYPENVTFDEGDVTITTLHLVGSKNDLNPWPGNTTATTAQQAEVTARLDAEVDLVESTFAHATQAGNRAVVLLTQADMFSGSGTTYRNAFKPVVQAIAAQSAAYGLPVMLVNGDTHLYKKDKPLAAGSSWLSYYGISTPVPNLTRTVVHAGTAEWLRVTVAPTADVFTTQRMPFQ